MAQSKTLSIKLSLNDKQFQSSLKKTSRSLKKFGSSLKTTGKNLTNSITLPVLALGVASAKLASDFEESLNKVNVAFGESSHIIQNFAKTTLNSFGIAEGSALEMASLFGDMATSMGITQQEAANMSTALVGLAGDLASFKNIGIEQAQTALAGIFTGETESLKRLGIVMTEANLKSFALSQGMDANVKSMTQAQKVALRYQFILKSTANAQGDFARTSEGVANTTRSVGESLKELGTEMGQILLPITKKVLNILKSVISRFNNLSDETKETIIQMGLLFAAIGPIIMVLGSLVTSLGVIIPIAVKVVAAINPITLAITGAVTAIGFFIKRISDLKKEHDEYNKVVGDFEPFQESFIPTTITPKKPKERTPDPNFEFKFIEPIKAIKVELQSIPDILEEIDVSFSDTFTKMERMAQELSATFTNAFNSMADGAKLSYKEIANASLNAARETIKGELSKAIAVQIGKILATVPFPFNVGIAAGAGAAVGGLFNKLIPKFADGGIVSGPTVGLMGEYAGANTNPEVIAPLNKLKDMIGGQTVQVQGMISGEDIYLSNDRYSRRKNSF